MTEKRRKHTGARFLHGLLIVAIYLFFPGFSPAAAGNHPSSASTLLAEANNDFTFKGRPIHPGLIKEFQNWLSDYRPPITVTVDVGAAYGTNEYGEAVTAENNGGVSITLANTGGNIGEWFFYKRFGRLDNGIHVLQTLDKTGGTGIFQSLTFVRFRLSAGFDRDGIKPSERLLMSVVRVYNIEGPNSPDIRIKGNEVRIETRGRITRLSFDEQ